MLCPELLPANACRFTALIHLLWFCCELFFFPSLSPSFFFLSVSATSRGALSCKFLIGTGRTNNTCGPRSHGAVSRRAAACRDCPAPAGSRPAPAWPGRSTETLPEPPSAKRGPCPAPAPAPSLKVDGFFRLSSTWKAPTRFTHYIK